MPLSWLYLQIEFASKICGETLPTRCRQDFSLSPVSTAADDGRDFVSECVDLSFSNTLKFLNVLKSIQYNMLLLSFRNQAIVIKTNMNAVVIIF